MSGIYPSYFTRDGSLMMMMMIMIMIMIMMTTGLLKILALTSCFHSEQTTDERFIPFSTDAFSSLP